jgi:hypothetical protein
MNRHALQAIRQPGLSDAEPERVLGEARWREPDAAPVALAAWETPATAHIPEFVETQPVLAAVSLVKLSV